MRTHSAPENWCSTERVTPASAAAAESQVLAQGPAPPPPRARFSVRRKPFCGRKPLGEGAAGAGFQARLAPLGGTEAALRPDCGLEATQTLGQGPLLRVCWSRGEAWGRDLVQDLSAIGTLPSLCEHSPGKGAVRGAKAAKAAREEEEGLKPKAAWVPSCSQGTSPPVSWAQRGMGNGSDCVGMGRLPPGWGGDPCSTRPGTGLRWLTPVSQVKTWSPQQQGILEWENS